MQVAILPLERITYGERFREDFGDLDSLIESIKKDGLIQPLAVRKIEDSFILLAGGRRFKACQISGIQTVPVRIYDEELSDLEMRSIELAENIFRKDLTWQEEVRLKKAIFDLNVEIHGEKVARTPDAPGFSKRDAADLLGESTANTIRDIKLAELLEKVPELANCDTKNEAQKLINKAKLTMKAAVVASKIQEDRRVTSLDIQHRKILDGYIVGDFLEKVKGIPADSVDLIEMDPPYGIGLNQIRIDNLGAGGAGSYVEVDKEVYPEFIQNCLSECFRVLNPEGWLVCWFAHEWRLMFEQTLTNVGFKISNLPAMWVKTSGQTMSPETTLASAWEPFYYARKGPARIKKPGRSNVFMSSRAPSQTRFHQAERPIEMIQEVLETFGSPNQRVMVPFLGSGNTLLAAANIGMSAWGYELSQEYKDKFSVNVVSSTPGSYKTFGQINYEDKLDNVSHS